MACLGAPLSGGRASAHLEARTPCAICQRQCLVPLCAQAHDEILVDFRRGRLLKKLVKLARGPSLMEPLERLEMGTLKVLAGVLIVHVVCFAVLMYEISDEEE